MSDELHVPLEEDLEPNRFERVATWLSAACAIHCLLVPVGMAVVPALGASSALHLSARVELILTAFVVVSVSAGAVWGFRRHRDLKIAAAMGLGLVIYLLGHAYEGAPLGQVLSVLGALALAAASFVSARSTQAACEHDHEH